MTNAKRFLKAYNSLDKTVRSLYGAKNNIGFSEMIRQAGNKNALLKHYKDDLYEYSRLRNAIVHDSNDEPIAEPHLDVVEKLEYILEQIQTPPLVVDVLKQETVLTINSSDTLHTFLACSVKRSYTHIPVYNQNKVVGVITAKYIIEALGEEIIQNGFIRKEYLLSTTVGSVMNKASFNYIFESEKLTLVQAITHFQENRQLKAIIITEKGDTIAPVLRIITSADAVEFQKRIF